MAQRKMNFDAYILACSTAYFDAKDSNLFTAVIPEFNVVHTASDRGGLLDWLDQYDATTRCLIFTPETPEPSENLIAMVWGKEAQKRMSA